jgi:Mce-associated membrane protein
VTSEHRLAEERAVIATEDDDVRAQDGPAEAVPRADDDAADETADDAVEVAPDAEEETAEQEDAGSRSRRRRRRTRAVPADDDEDADVDRGDDDDVRRARISFPLVPALVILLVLLLGGLGYLWFTRPAKSSVTTADYVQALQAARSAVVDLTSFDYLTLDDDIAQIRGITTGDLQDEAVKQLDDNRQTITQSESTVNTEVVAAAVTAADADHATVLLVIQSTQKNNTSDQAQVTKYRIQATLEKHDGRWLLSGIAGR